MRPKMSSNTNDQVYGERQERHPPDKPENEDLGEDYVKVRWETSIDFKYLLKHHGCAKIMQLAASGICSCYVLAVEKQDEGKVMDLPMHWRLEVLALVAVASLMFSSVFFTFNFFKFTYQFPFEFHKVDMFISSVFFVAFGVLGVLVLEVALYYEEHYPEWKTIQAHESSIFAIFAAISYAFGVFALLRHIRGNGQFRRRILYNEQDGDTPEPIVRFDGAMISYEDPAPNWVTATTTPELGEAPIEQQQLTSVGEQANDPINVLNVP